MRQALKVVLTQLVSYLEVLEVGDCQDALGPAEACIDLELWRLDIRCPA